MRPDLLSAYKAKMMPARHGDSDIRLRLTASIIIEERFSKGNRRRCFIAAPLLLDFSFCDYFFDSS